MFLCLVSSNSIFEKLLALSLCLTISKALCGRILISVSLFVESFTFIFVRFFSASNSSLTSNFVSTSSSLSLSSSLLLLTDLNSIFLFNIPSSELSTILVFTIWIFPSASTILFTSLVEVIVSPSFVLSFVSVFILEPSLIVISLDFSISVFLSALLSLFELPELLLSLLLFPEFPEFPFPLLPLSPSLSAKTLVDKLISRIPDITKENSKIKANFFIYYIINGDI